MEDKEIRLALVVEQIALTKANVTILTDKLKDIDVNDKRWYKCFNEREEHYKHLFRLRQEQQKLHKQIYTI